MQHHWPSGMPTFRHWALLVVVAAAGVGGALAVWSAPAPYEVSAVSAWSAPDEDAEVLIAAASDAVLAVADRHPSIGLETIEGSRADTREMWISARGADPASARRAVAEALAAVRESTRALQGEEDLDQQISPIAHRPTTFGAGRLVAGAGGAAMVAAVVLGVVAALRRIGSSNDGRAPGRSHEDESVDGGLAPSDEARPAPGAAAPAPEGAPPRPSAAPLSPAHQRAELVRRLMHEERERSGDDAPWGEEERRAALARVEQRLALGADEPADDLRAAGR